MSYTVSINVSQQTTNWLMITYYTMKHKDNLTQTEQRLLSEIRDELERRGKLTRKGA